MPFVRIDGVVGRAEEEIKALLDAAHEAVVEAFHVPASDRYQVYSEHPAGHVVLQDTGLGFRRTASRVVITVISKKRDEAMKEALYHALARHLKESCQIDPDDVVVCVVDNESANWSFGAGEAQFLNGKL